MEELATHEFCSSIKFYLFIFIFFTYEFILKQRIFCSVLDFEDSVGLAEATVLPLDVVVNSYVRYEYACEIVSTRFV